MCCFVCRFGEQIGVFTHRGPLEDRFREQIGLFTHREPLETLPREQIGVFTHRGPLEDRFREQIGLFTHREPWCRWNGGREESFLDVIGNLSLT